MSPSFNKSLCLLGCLLVMLCGSAVAKEVLRFDAETWPQLLASPQRPLAVVFTTTDCEYCPAVIDELARTIRKSHASAKLVVAVMDDTQRGDELLANRHFRQADLLYSFDVQETARLRYTIDPEWRGVTPYVVLIARNGTVSRYAGTPPAAEVRRFLRRK